MDPAPPATAAAVRGSYEVELIGPVPAQLNAAYPEAVSRWTAAETVLTAEDTDGAALDVLLDKLLSMGLVLTEVHERPGGPGTASSCPPGQAAS